MDLTLRDDVGLQSAIQTASEIDQQSKQAGLNQESLDQIARQGFSSGLFENEIESNDLIENVNLLDGQDNDDLKGGQNELNIFKHLRYNTIQ